MSDTFAFFGTPYVARDTLALLREHGFTPSVVVTNPDAPRGRGRMISPTETKVWALEHNMPVETPERLDETVIKTLQKYDCTYAIVVAYGKILPETLINTFPKGILNVHYSLLPKYRGASPVEAALRNGEETTGVTIQKMAAKLDAGAVIAQEEVSIEPNETTKELRPRLVRIGAELLVKTLPNYLEHKVELQSQDDAAATYAHKLTKEDGLIDLEAPSMENWNKYRAYTVWPGTYFFTKQNDKEIRVKITNATFENGEFKILKVIPEGKKETDYEIFKGTSVTDQIL